MKTEEGKKQSVSDRNGCSIKFGLDGYVLIFDHQWHVFGDAEFDKLVAKLKEIRSIVKKRQA